MLLLQLRIANQLIWGMMRKHADVNPFEKVVTKQFRCWPVDLDIFGHMNNASYIRVGELCRWRMLAASGMLPKMLKDQVAFLVTEQKVTYLKPIDPFQTYNVNTSVTVDETGKWALYKHSFQSISPDPKKAVTYGTVEVKAVLKQRDGKTVRAGDYTRSNDYFKRFVVNEQQDERVD
jgi:acyl-CoA thioesterase FadM